MMTEARNEEDVGQNIITNRTVTILSRGPNHIVALKPPTVVCHHSGYTSSRKPKKGEEPVIPMLQRVRDGIHEIDSRGLGNNEELPTRRVNLIHRLDRGASGALLMAYADDSSINVFEDYKTKGSTALLSEAMASPESTKTYVALVRGEGILSGDDLIQKGWFEVSRPIKNENGVEKNATTLFKFVAGQPEICEDGVDQPRMSLVLARPKSGRWHQVRRHLNGLSHPILGDSTHGSSKINREWKEKRNLPNERICLHCARIQIPPTDAVPEGIDVSCPILDDMMNMLRVYAPQVLERSLPVLEEEGVLWEAQKDYEVGEYATSEEVLQAVVKDDVEVEILKQGENYVVARKPPSVVVHHSSWIKSKWKEPIPMLQRVRDATGRLVNPIHRLDRGASGCLVFAIAENIKNDDGEKIPCRATRALVNSLKNSEATKTYVALCDGDGVWSDVDYTKKGWFTVDNPVNDENGKRIEDCRTDICFIAKMILPSTEEDPDNMEGRKVCMVLARPHTGRWHQIRQHLASGTIGHAIIGDATHGRSRTNRIWKKNRHLIKERVCLHLLRVQLPATEYTPDGIDVTCPLPPDLLKILDEMPDLLDQARPILSKEGIEV